MTKITLGELPARPEGTKAPGLTTELWNGLMRCWDRNPKGRITISEILQLMRSTWVFSFLRDRSVLCLLTVRSKISNRERRRLQVGIVDRRNDGWNEEIRRRTAEAL